MKIAKTAVALAVLSLANAASAQLEEVVVTAQKVESSLQDTPIAITAFSSKTLEDIGAFNATDVGQFAPNVSILPTFGSAGNIRTNIRGISTGEPSLTVDPKVGLYLDGVYIARNAGAIFDIVDMERVEVLRGPQGTLWGKNTTGGAVSMITSKPTGQWGIKQALTVGNEDEFRSITTVNTKETAGLSATLSYMYKTYDGWAENSNPVSEKQLGSEHIDAYRVALSWAPTDSLVADYTYDDTTTKAVAVPLQITHIGPGTTDPNLIGAYNVETSTFYSGYNPLQLMESVLQPDHRVDKFYLDNLGEETAKVFGHNLTLDWQAGPLEIKSITGYREYDSDLPRNDLDGGSWETADGVAVPMFHTADTKQQDQFSQEFQFIGSALDSKLDYVVGLYYFEEQGKEANPWEAMFYVPGQPVLLGAIGPSLGSWYKTDNTAKAAYSQLKYYFNESWDVTAGVRYSDDTKKITLLGDDPRLNRHSADAGWTKTTTDFIVAYRMNDEINFYAKRAEGYNAGVYSIGALNHNDYTDFEVFDTPADPEEVVSYEVGMKAQWLDNRLRTNGAIFYNDNKNLQITEFVQGVRTVTNSGSNHTEGLELEFTGLLSDAFTVIGAYGYYKTNFEGGGPRARGKNSGRLSLVYSRPMGWGDLNARFDTTYTDDQQFSSSPYGNAESYALMSARLGVAGIAVGDVGTVACGPVGTQPGRQGVQGVRCRPGYRSGSGLRGQLFRCPQELWHRYGLRILIATPQML